MRLRVAILLTTPSNISPDRKRFIRFNNKKWFEGAGPFPKYYHICSIGISLANTCFVICDIELSCSYVVYSYVVYSQFSLQFEFPLNLWLSVFVFSQGHALGMKRWSLVVSSSLVWKFCCCSQAQGMFWPAPLPVPYFVPINRCVGIPLPWSLSGFLGTFQGFSLSLAYLVWLDLLVFW